jgi:long-chain acyl-CoA synthetase
LASGAPDTGDLISIPALLARNARAYGARPAYREKEFGIWQCWSWAEAEAEIRAMAAGFLVLGVERGDTVAVIGRNRPALYWAMVAAQMTGAIPVPLYQDAVAEEMAYVLDHCGARFVVAGDQEQVDKVLEIAGRLPALEHMMYLDPRGLRKYDHTKLHALDNIIAEGRLALDRLGRELAARIAEIDDDTTCVMLYTSGTTGKPKGVVLSNRNIIATARASCEFDNLGQDEEVLAYLPMAWVGDFIFSIGQAYWAGFCVNCPESADTMMTDLREIGPTYFFAPPRVFETVLTNVMIRMEDAGDLKHGLFHHFMAFAKDKGEAYGIPKMRRKQSTPTLRRRLRWLFRYSMGIGFAIETLIENAVKLAVVRLRHPLEARKHFRGRGPLLNLYPQPLRDYFEYRTGDVLIFGPLKNTLGLSRVRVAYTAGEAIGPEIFDFYRSLGINLKQLYGQTEASVFITQQPDGEVRSDTVGVPSPGVEVKIGEAGEVYYRSPGTFRGILQERRIDRVHQGPRRLGRHRGCRVLRTRYRASADHRPRQGCGQDGRWQPVRAQICREQAEILPRYPGGGGVRRRPRPLLRLHQYRPDGGWQLGRTQQHRLCQLSGTGPAPARAGHDPRPCGNGEPKRGRGPDAVGLPDPPLSGAAQGTRCRRRGTDPHAESAPQHHFREICRSGDGSPR